MGWAESNRFLYQEYKLQNPDPVIRPCVMYSQTLASAVVSQSHSHPNSYCLLHGGNR